MGQLLCPGVDDVKLTHLGIDRLHDVSKTHLCTMRIYHSADEIGACKCAAGCGMGQYYVDCTYVGIKLAFTM